MRRFSVVAAAALLGLLAAPAGADTFTFTHLAGSTGGAGTDDGTGNQARFRVVSGLTVAPDGSLFASDAYSATVRQISAGGSVTTFAGMADDHALEPGRRGENRLYSPRGLEVDADGNLYIADDAAHVILRVTPGGVLSTWAGHIWASGSANGSLTEARFLQPSDVAIDSDGNVFIADFGNHTIRKITPAGVVSTFAGSPGLSGSEDGTGSAARFNHPVAICVDAEDDLYVADYDNHTIRRITPERVVSTVAGLAGSPGFAEGTGSIARFSHPSGIASASGGIVYVGDRFNNRVRKITSAGEVYTVSTYAGAANCEWIDGAIGTARFCRPASLAVDGDGSVYVADLDTNSVRKVTTTDAVSTLAGRGNISGYANASGGAARFARPVDVAVSSSGEVFVADTNNHVIRKISGAFVAVTLFAGTAFSSGSNDGVGAAARFRQPAGLAVDGSSNVYVADTENHTIRKIDPDRNVSTFAGAAGMTGSDDGTGDAARFTWPADVASDGTNIYVADRANHTIRKITSSRVVTTLAGFAGESGSADGTALARFNNPYALAADSAGNVYVADTGNHTVRMVTPSGVVTTIAGTAGMPGDADGTGAAARFASPHGIAVEERGGSVYLYVSEIQNTIRMIAPGNVVTTIGGSPDTDSAMTDGTGGVSRFDFPRGLFFRDGALYIADSENNCIRRGAAAISTVATIDSPTGAVGAVRQLQASPSALSHSWTIVRRPAGSTATLSWVSVAAPTFTPDIPDVYRFRLFASNSNDRSITEVGLTAECPTLTLTPASLPAGQVSIPYSQTLVAGGGVAPYTMTTLSGGIPPGMTLSSAGVLSGTPTEVGSYTFSVEAADDYGCTVQRSYTLVIQNIQPPTGVVATATATNSVSLTWSASTGATGYRVYRGTNMSSLSLLTSVAGLAHADGTVTANTSYLYKVRAYDSSGHESVDSAGDVATTVIFTDPALGVGTVVKAVHFTQLRTAINALRALAALGAYTTWCVPGPAAGVRVRSCHLSDLRVAVIPALMALGRSTSFTDPALGPGYEIAAVHITELRNKVQ